MKNVLITTSSFGGEGLAKIEAAKLKPILNPYKRKLTEEELAQLLYQFQPIGMIAGVEPITRAIIEHAPFLKAISRCGVGMDSVDLLASKELGVTVTNTPDAPTIPVAELTVGIILSVLRGIHLADASVRSGGWDRPMGSLLYGRTVGIIGCGRIGSYVAKLCLAFGSKMLGYDPYCSTNPNINLVSLESLLVKSDIVSLHIPYNKENHHFMDSERIALMKHGAVLINASRGGLVNERALAEAIQAGKLLGASIDCFEQEPYSGPLIHIKNTLLTSHIGSYAKEGRMMMEGQAVENLINTLREKQWIN